MSLKKNILRALLAIMLTLSSIVQATPTVLKPFVAGSYQQILANTANSPFMLVIWSITCSSCLKDMALLNNLHKSKPELKIIMLATDGVAENKRIEDILQKNELTSVENWNYADDNTAKLQYEIDPTWYGEQPRTYFFDKTHQRQGISGVLTEKDYLNHVETLLK